MLVAFLVLFSRLVQLQILTGKLNRFLAENNRFQRILLEAPRGLILDRHGEILARNEPVFLYDNKEVNRDSALKLQEENQESGLRIKLSRKYPYGEIFSHLIGYLGEVSVEELDEGKLKFKGYSPGSLIGRSGVESEYEEKLAGQEGSELVEVDTTGKTIRRMRRILPISGKILTLAVERKLQEAAAAAMAGRKGAVVASNPRNGEILVLYSSPSFDNNLFMDKENPQLVKIISDEENLPLLNRVISGLYPPGSTFKIVTSVAGLEEGKITGDTLINDPGVLTVGQFRYANWYFSSYGKTEGEINLVRAITRSTDTFFYKVGEFVGAEKLNFWAEKFGLNKVFGVDLPGEMPGFVGTPEWKKKNRGENWFLGNTYHLAIGQGDLSLTPLGVNLMTAVVANKGKICTPRILRIGAENTPYQAECKEIGIKKEYLELIKQGMIGACSAGGTAWPFFEWNGSQNWTEKHGNAACKTGTAETGDGKTTHAWFTVFAPADDPQIVLTVLVEKGGEGSSVAAPIAKEILKEYFAEQ